MKLFSIFMLVFTLGGFASGYSQKQVVTLNLKQCDVNTLLQEIWKQTGLRFVYNEQDVAQLKRFDVNAQQKQVDEILDHIFKNTPYQCAYESDVIYITPRPVGDLPQVKQERVKLSGNIKDKNGNVLPGVTVFIGNSDIGTSSDINGNYQLAILKGNAVEIVYSFIGMKKQTLQVDATRKKMLEITMVDDVKTLEDVVVTGYSNVRKSSFTGSSTQITGDELRKVSQTNVLDAMQSFDPSFRLMTNTQFGSDPNALPEMYIRGRSGVGVRDLDKNQLSKSNLENNPNLPTFIMDGFEVSIEKVYDLDPSRIESMTILKDAAATAIYGSRAANGVILITTKAGAAGNAKVSLTAQFGLNKVADKVESLNAAQYKELQDEIGLVSLPDGLPDRTDWFDETYTTGKTQNYQVAVSNGNEKMKYYLSAGYLKEQGVLDISYYKRYNFRVNLENQVRKWLTVSANISYSDYTSNGGGAMGTGSNRGGVILAVINTPTYAPVWDALNPNQYYNNFYGVGNITNPLENMARAKNNKDKENRLLASGNILLTPFPELKFKSTLTLDRRNAVNTTFLDPISTAWGRNQYGEASDNRNMNTVLTFDNVLTYNKNFKKHGLEVMAGSSWTDSDYSNSWINGSHYRSDQIQTLNAANKISWDNTGTGASQWGIMSFFGRVAYNFDSKYLVTANLRADGSSKLHPNHRWGVFPSFSAAWRISSEKFMEDLTWIDDLKLRGGWGQTGNQSGIGDYAYLQRYNIGRIEWFKKGGEGDSTDYANAVPTISQANLRTSDLTWETTTQTNIGLDLTILNGRLTFNADYYYKKTKNMLMNVSLPAGAAAATSIARNEGEMVNKGFELSISSKNLRGGAFTWDTDFNISFNRNKLTKLELQKVYYDAKTADVVNDYVVRNEPGRALGGFYGYISDGVDPETGELMYRDLNNDGKISSSDRTYIGDPNPDFTYGMTNTFSWKGFNLSIFIQGSYGNDIYNASRIETEGMYDGKNQSARVLNRWKIPGQITDVPKANFKLLNSTYFVEDGSYLRLKDVSLSYNVKGKLLKKWGITRLQPYFTATNLLTWTSYSGMDPEVNQWGNSGTVQGIDWGTYPHCRSYVFGINVEF